MMSYMIRTEVAAMQNISWSTLKDTYMYMYISYPNIPSYHITSTISMEEMEGRGWVMHTDMHTPLK